MNARYSKFMLALGCGLTLSLLTPAHCQPPEAPYLEPTPLTTINLISWPELSRQLGGPSLLTLHLNAASPQEVAAKLSRQSPWPFSLAPGEKDVPSITDRFDEQPYWSVVRALEQQTGFLSQANAHRPGVWWGPKPPQMWLPLPSQGPFDFSLRSPELPLGTDINASNSLHFALQFRVLIDPKVLLLNDIVSCRLLQAKDGNNELLVPDEPEKRLVSNNLNQSIKSLDLTLKPYDDMRRQVKFLQGELRTIVVTQQETWDIPSPLYATHLERVFERGGNRDRIMLEQVQRQGNDYVVKIVVTRAKAGETQFFLNANGEKIYSSLERLGPVRLLDTQGRDLGYCQFASTTIYGDEASTAHLACTFSHDPTDPAPAGVPAKLLITIPNRWSELVVPFEFHDLKFP